MTRIWLIYCACDIELLEVAWSEKSAKRIARKRAPVRVHTAEYDRQRDDGEVVGEVYAWTEQSTRTMIDATTGAESS